MSTEYTWKIKAMNCYPEVSGQSDVVFAVHWDCTGRNESYTSNCFSTCAIPLVEDTFIPFSELTEEQVLGWIWANGVNKTVTEASVEEAIQRQIRPPVVTPPLPWSAV